MLLESTPLSMLVVRLLRNLPKPAFDAPVVVDGLLHQLQVVRVGASRRLQCRTQGQWSISGGADSFHVHRAVTRECSRIRASSILVLPLVFGRPVGTPAARPIRPGVFAPWRSLLPAHEGRARACKETTPVGSGVVRCQPAETTACRPSTPQVPPGLPPPSPQPPVPRR